MVRLTTSYGKFGSTHGVFAGALKAGLELKQKFPYSRIKVHDADHEAPSLGGENGFDTANGLNGAD